MTRRRKWCWDSNSWIEGSLRRRDFLWSIVSIIFGLSNPQIWIREKGLKYSQISKRWPTLLIQGRLVPCVWSKSISNDPCFINGENSTFEYGQWWTQKMKYTFINRATCAHPPANTALIIQICIFIWQINASKSKIKKSMVNTRPETPCPLQISRTILTPTNSRRKDQT